MGAEDGAAEAEAPPRLCPSARAEVGAALIGVVQGDGTVALLGRPLPVTQAFLDAAREGRSPERRFRFAAPCVRSECRQWRGSAEDAEGGRCGVIDRVTAALGPELSAEAGRARPCGVRRSCRWFAQGGAAACDACRLVITETRAGPEPAPVPA